MTCWGISETDPPGCNVEWVEGPQGWKRAGAPGEKQ